MSFDAERLYALLPAVYRLRDLELAGQLGDLLEPAENAELQALLAAAPPLTARQARRLAELQEKRQRGPLKALLSVIAEQVAVLEEDLAQLYDDQFIETCAEWVVPYIGDLVGTRGLFVFPGAKFSQRTQVANTLAYRRRKGTAAILEQLARDVTGWDASVVEYFSRLATTQYMNHLRPENLAVADLRRARNFDYVNTPFDQFARTADVRSIESRRGKYNIPNVGIFLWRIGSYSLTDAPAYKLDDRRFFFDALGRNAPLYNRPETEDEITHLAEPINVPAPLTRRALNRQLETYYGLDARGEGRSLLLHVNGHDIVAAPPRSLADLISVCDLSDVRDAGGNVTGWAHLPTQKIAIDPVLGRIAFPTGSSAPQSVRVSYHYGFSAEMGGGKYGRRATSFSELETVVRVPTDEETIRDALDNLTAKFSADSQLAGGVIEIENNDYHVAGGAFDVPAGKLIEVRAAVKRRPVLVLDGELNIGGGIDAELLFNGLLITGGGGALRVPGAVGNNHLRRLALRHCTLPPGESPAFKSISVPGGGAPRDFPAHAAAPVVIVEAANVRVEIEHSITGALRVVEGARAQIANSIVDAGAETNIAYAAPDDGSAGGVLEIENSTIIGRVRTRLVELASNTIFIAAFVAGESWPAPVTAQTAPVLAERLQQGCVRFSYVPPGSSVPRQFHCQPDKSSEAARVRPVFTSLRFGDAGYCQLDARCAPEITQGADDQAEMGAFHDLYQPQREANLRARLDEYLRFGLEAGIFHAS